MAFNAQRGNTLTIASGAKVSTTLDLGCDALLGLYVPTLDTCDLAVSGAVIARKQGGDLIASGGPAPIVNEAGAQVLLFPATVGNFVLGAKSLADLAGLSQITIVSSATQSAPRVFVLSQKVPDR